MSAKDFLVSEDAISRILLFVQKLLEVFETVTISLGEFDFL
jgi:hypothetical protein